MRRIFFISLLVLGIFWTTPAHAVLIDDNGATSYNTSAPTDSDVAGWTSGWGSSGVTGWDYVGQVDGTGADASGVYLGNNYVLTAGHVGAGTFTLDGTTYNLVSGSAQSISDSNGLADLTLFRISTAPALPSLVINVSVPSIGVSMVMTGYGGGQGETWGKNRVTSNNLLVQISSYNTVDFETAYTGNNFAQLVSGDSGGGDFLFDSTTQQWELAGINEAIDGSNDSYMVDLSKYATQITDLESTPVPEPRQTAALLLLGAITLSIARKLKARLTSNSSRDLCKSRPSSNLSS